MRFRTRFLLLVFATLLICTISIFVAYSSQSQLVSGINLFLKPTPRFLSVRPAPGYQGPYSGPLCVDIKIGPPLVNDTEQGLYLIYHTHLSLDGQNYDSTATEPIDLFVLGTDIDTDGSRITWGGPLETCYNFTWSEGSHIANLQIESMSGRVYSYSWPILITDSGGYSVVLTATGDSYATLFAQMEGTPTPMPPIP